MQNVHIYNVIPFYQDKIYKKSYTCKGVIWSTDVCLGQLRAIIRENIKGSLPHVYTGSFFLVSRING